MEDGKPTKLRGFMTDISDLKDREEKIKYISFHDGLTGLYNRRYFEEELERIDNPRNYPITIVFGDVNELKQMNDTFGHLQGDKIIKDIANVLNKYSRSNDTVARWGGDEFAIIMPKTSLEDAKHFIDRINKSISKFHHPFKKKAFAVGLATKTTKEESMMDNI